MAFVRYTVIFLLFIFLALHANTRCIYAIEQRVDHSKKQPTQTNAMEFVSAGEGKTLPKDVMRVRFVHMHRSGSFGFDEHASKIHMGIRQNTGIGVFVSEYGISNKLSFQLLTPYVYLNQVSTDQEQFVRSSIINTRYKSELKKTAAKLQKQGICESSEECLTLLSRDFRAPMNMETTLPTGETNLVKQGERFDLSILKTILSAATPPEHGAVGLGDMETGLLYNFVTTDHYSFSTGVGLRIPTGDFNLPETLRPVSGGVYDLGIRFNFDISPFKGLWISFKEQVEQSLSKASWKSPSLLNPESFATPLDETYKQNNSKIYSKEGWNYETLLKAMYGLGALHPNLKAFAIQSSYEYNQSRIIKLENEIHEPITKTHKISYGGSVSGLPYGIPLELEANYSQPIKGEHLKIAANQLDTSLKFYAKF